MTVSNTLECTEEIPVKPLLIIPSKAGANVVNINDTTIEVLNYLNSTGSCFNKGGVLVRKTLDARGEPRLSVLSPHALHTLLFEEMNVCRWGSQNKQPSVLKATEIKDSFLKTFMHSHQCEALLRPISVIAKKPYMVLSNSKLVMLQPGYNAARGGIFVTGDQEPVNVGVPEAVPALLNLLSDFNFATQSDKARMVGAMLCAVLRLAGIYSRHPMLAFEADESQAGKTKLWAMICAIMGQRYGTIAQKKGGVGSLDEQIQEKLVDGLVAILFDNMRGGLDSCTLEAALTPEDGVISARIPGLRSIEVDPRPVLFGLTSNGVQLTKDLANRTLMIRIRKRPGEYVFKEWPDDTGAPVGICEHIQASQAYYQGCVNAIVRHWWEGGAQKLPCTQHDFKDCIGGLDYLVQKYFGLPSIMDGHKAEIERTTKPGLTWLRSIALKAAQSWFALEWTATKIADRCIDEGIAIPGAKSEIDGDGGAKLVGNAMAQAFASSNKLEVDGVEILRHESNDNEGRLRRTYSFRKKEVVDDVLHALLFPEPPEGPEGYDDFKNEN